MPGRENRRNRRRREREQRKEDKKGIRRAKETPLARWTRLYAEKARFRERMSPVYNRAVSPLVAGTLSFIRHPHLRILVVGGGKGVFSRHLFPAIQADLHHLGKHPKITIIESDILRLVKDAPSPHRLQMDSGRLALQNETIDLVVGQSMLHQGSLEHNIAEITRVLRPDGFMIHIQDDLPGAAPIGGKKPIVIPKGAEKQVAAKQAFEIHQRFLERIIQEAGKNGLPNAIMQAQAELLVPQTHSIGAFGGVNLDEYNSIYYVNGRIRGQNEPKIPPGKKKLVYAGIAVILSKEKVSPLVHHLQKIHSKLE